MSGEQLGLSRGTIDETDVEVTSDWRTACGSSVNCVEVATAEVVTKLSQLSLGEAVQGVSQS